MPGRLGLDMILASAVSCSVEYRAPRLLLRRTGRRSWSQQQKLCEKSKKENRYLLLGGVATFIGLIKKFFPPHVLTLTHPLLSLFGWQCSRVALRHGTLVVLAIMLMGCY